MLVVRWHWLASLQLLRATALRRMLGDRRNVSRLGSGHPRSRHRVPPHLGRDVVRGMSATHVRRGSQGDSPPMTTAITLSAIRALARILRIVNLVPIAERPWLIRNLRDALHGSNGGSTRGEPPNEPQVQRTLEPLVQIAG